MAMAFGVVSFRDAVFGDSAIIDVAFGNGAFRGTFCGGNIAGGSLVGSLTSREARREVGEVSRQHSGARSLEYEFQKPGCEGKACRLYYEHSSKGKGIGEGQTLKTEFVYNEELRGRLRERVLRSTYCQGGIAREGPTDPLTSSH